MEFDDFSPLSISRICLVFLNFYSNDFILLQFLMQSSLTKLFSTLKITRKSLLSSGSDSCLCSLMSVSFIKSLHRGRTRIRKPSILDTGATSCVMPVWGAPLCDNGSSCILLSPGCARERAAPTLKVSRTFQLLGTAGPHA